MKVVLLAAVSCLLLSAVSACTPSRTTAGGFAAPGTICSGDLIFQDNFDRLDEGIWQHENTLAGGGNWEFQWYRNDRRNSYVRDGVCHFVPTYVSDEKGEGFLSTGRVQITDGCTQANWYGCDRQGTWDNIINPIFSARVSSVDSFHFTYGTMEVRAKLPAGDWIWPALWLMPKWSVYGGWPTSGEIDLMESRGNRDMHHNGVHIGTQQIGSTLHFGPSVEQNAFYTSTFARNQNPGFNDNFHVYKLVWTPEYLQFQVDGNVVGTVDPGEGGMWARGGFSGHNPWQGRGRMAPFDQDFYIIMNLAIGGTNGYFPDGVSNGFGPKPWPNNSPTAMRDFWWARGNWEPTWQNWGNPGDHSHLQVDYVRVWAL